MDVASDVRYDIQHFPSPYYCQLSLPAPETTTPEYWSTVERETEVNPRLLKTLTSTYHRHRQQQDDNSNHYLTSRHPQAMYSYDAG
jgi:hypothetical protein